MHGTIRCSTILTHCPIIGVHYTQARWAAKHGVSHYAYKNPVNVDQQHKLIRRYTVTDEAVHDSQVLEDALLTQAAGKEVWADAAYRSQAIETHLRRRQLRSRIQSIRVTGIPH